MTNGELISVEFNTKRKRTTELITDVGSWFFVLKGLSSLVPTKQVSTSGSSQYWDKDSESCHRPDTIHESKINTRLLLTTFIR